MQSETKASALTDRAYWDRIWSQTRSPSVNGDPGGPDAWSAPASSVPRPVQRIDLRRDPHQARLAACFAEFLGPGKRFLEVGAGGSPWPVHVAEALGAEPWGIDFSRPGLASVERDARERGVAVSLIEADLFDENALPERAFDLVYSGGFVEHFTDAAPLMRRLARLLRPGGVIVTTVPNLEGINGLLQRLVDRACFDRHVVFTPRSLDAAHHLGGLHPRSPARYQGVLDLASVNFGARLSQLPAPAQRALWATLSTARRIAEAVGDLLHRSDGGSHFSPAIIGVYETR